MQDSHANMCSAQLDPQAQRRSFSLKPSNIDCPLFDKRMQGLMWVLHKLVDQKEALPWK